MPTRNAKLRFNGGLNDGQITAAESASLDRVQRRVQLALDYPSVDAVAIQIRLDGVVQDQLYTLPAGTRSTVIPVDGDGLLVAANVLRDAVVVGLTSAANLDVNIEDEAATLPAGGTDTDCGLGMLHEIKQHLLAESFVTDDAFDLALTQIGQGLAGAFDRHCNRLIRRSTSATEIHRPNSTLILARRYPLEDTPTVEQRLTLTEGYAAVADAVEDYDPEAGLIYLSSQLPGTLKVTVKGGNWYDTTSNGSGSLPAGATLLPNEVKLAWLLQCAHVWANRDNLGLQLGEKPAARSQLENAELIPAVKEKLAGFRRMAIL